MYDPSSVMVKLQLVFDAVTSRHDLTVGPAAPAVTVSVEGVYTVDDGVPYCMEEYMM